MSTLKKNIPNFLTLSNLALGFCAIVYNDARWSPIMILGALICDVFDGMLARKFGSDGDMGKQLDSLADLVSFGVAPAYLYYQLSPFGSIALIPCIALVAASAWRLAKFNLLPGYDYFLGIPTPASAMATLGLIASYREIPITKTFVDHPIFYTAYALIIALLMVSNLKMFSLKSVDKKRPASYLRHLVVAIIFGGSIVYFGALATSIAMAAYVCINIISIFKHKQA